MEHARDYAALPHEYMEEMAALDDAEFGRLVRALLEYSRSGTPMALLRSLVLRAKRTNYL